LNDNNYILLAIGNADGTIEIYCMPSFSQLFVLRQHSYLINRLKWTHYTESNITRTLLASASEDGTIGIFELQPKNALNISSEKFECLYVLRGHQQSVCDIAWNPKQSNLLASASFDHTGEVWNALDGKPICNLRGHEGRVFCIMWSRSKENILYTGSDDQTVRAWNITKQPFVLPPLSEKKALKKRKKNLKV